MTAREHGHGASGSSGGTELGALMQRIGETACAAAAVLALADSAGKNRALAAAAAALRGRREELLQANAADMEAARSKGVSAALLDRLRLDAKRIESMARGIEDVAALPDPIGTVAA